MNFFRNHWYDVGGILGIITILFLYFDFGEFSNYQHLMWFSLVTLFLHQLEEYRIVGTFPGMINHHLFKSDIPNRFPLNPNTAMIINVYVGWGTYLLAAIGGTHTIWLGMATILISLGNIIAHTFFFNIKSKTFFNAGLATSWLFFAPCVFYFFYLIHHENVVSIGDYIIGIPLGIILNIFGVLKPITWLADRNTKYRFKESQLLPCDRN